MPHDSEFLVMVHADNVRTAEKNAMAKTRETLREVMTHCSEIATVACEDLTDGFLNPPAILAGCFS